MYVTATKEPETFKPVQLEILFQSQEELDFFGTMMNHVTVCKMEFRGNRFGATFGKPIRIVLEKQGANIELTGEILK